MLLHNACVAYTHYIYCGDLPDDVQDILYQAAINEDLGSMLDYVDGDFKVTPSWVDPDMAALTDIELQVVFSGDMAEGQTEADLDAMYDTLSEKLCNVFGSVPQVDTACALEIARRAILKALPETEQIMRDNMLAIAFYQ